MALIQMHSFRAFLRAEIVPPADGRPDRIGRPELAHLLM